MNNLHPRIQEALKTLNITELTPLQHRTYNSTTDLIVQAPTGSGKTLAYLLPIARHIIKHNNGLTAVVIVPTRELALQICEVASLLCECHVVIGNDGKRAGLNNALSNSSKRKSDYDNNIKKKHKTAWKLENEANNNISYIINIPSTCKIIIATPGRLYKLVEQDQKLFKNIKYLILDEGDKLLSLGFENILTKIINKLPKSRITGIFTATIDEAIKKLSRLSLRNPITIKEDGVIPRQLVMEYIELKAFEKFGMLVDFVKRYKCIVFFASCAEVDYFYELIKRLSDEICDICVECDANESEKQNDRSYNNNRDVGKISDSFDKNNIITINNHEENKHIIDDSQEKKCEQKNQRELYDKNHVTSDNNIEDHVKTSVYIDGYNNELKSNELYINDYNINKHNKNIDITQKNNNNTQDNNMMHQILQEVSLKHLNKQQKYYCCRKNCKNFIIHKMHGKMKNEERQTVYKNFSSCFSSLFCTDIAARGIDFKNVDYVIHFDAPLDPSNFIHRSGRTARNTQEGKSVIFIMKNEISFLNYLKIKNVCIFKSNEEIKKINYNCLKKLFNDKLINLSILAFISYIRSYKEHCLSYIFNLKEIDFNSAIALHFLDKVPKMNELQNIKFEKFARPEKNKKNKNKKYHK
ncbi:ATP-dependent rRNA helicase spb4 [Conglomerata obtusa]